MRHICNYYIILIATTCAKFPQHIPTGIILDKENWKRWISSTSVPELFPMDHVIHTAFQFVPNTGTRICSRQPRIPTLGRRGGQFYTFDNPRYDNLTVVKCCKKSPFKLRNYWENTSITLRSRIYCIENLYHCEEAVKLFLGQLGRRPWLHSCIAKFASAVGLEFILAATGSQGPTLVKCRNVMDAP
jgi:hypothetical protein